MAEVCQLVQQHASRWLVVAAESDIETYLQQDSRMTELLRRWGRWGVGAKRGLYERVAAEVGHAEGQGLGFRVEPKEQLGCCTLEHTEYWDADSVLLCSTP